MHTLRKSPETITHQAITWTPKEVAKRKATEHMAKRHIKRYEEGEIHQERDGEDGPKQATVAFIDWWPMLNETNRISK